MRLSQILSDRKIVQIGIGDDALNVTYRPQAITPETLDRMTAANDKPGAAIVETVVEMVADWDLTDDDGSPYPLTIKDVRRLPVSFLSTIVKEITDDLNPNAGKRKTSGATSSLAGA